MQSSDSRTVPGEVGFTVTQNAPYRPEDGVAVYFQVDLPHQCDEWTITSYQASRGEAIAELLAFIAEANAALDVLRAMPDAQVEWHDPKFAEAERNDEGRIKWQCVKVWSDGVRCETYTWGDPQQYVGPCSYLRRHAAV